MADNKLPMDYFGDTIDGAPIESGVWYHFVRAEDGTVKLAKGEVSIDLSKHQIYHDGLGFFGPSILTHEVTDNDD